MTTTRHISREWNFISYLQQDTFTGKVLQTVVEEAKNEYFSFYTDEYVALLCTKKIENATKQAFTDLTKFQMPDFESLTYWEKEICFNKIWSPIKHKIEARVNALKTHPHSDIDFKILQTDLEHVRDSFCLLTR